MISIIVAIGVDNLIGKGNDLPWYYPSDLKYFKQKTLNKTVLMGEQTFLSIFNRNNKPLPNRKNIVATLDETFKYPGIEITNDLVKFLKQKHDEEIFVIGGLQIYKLALPYADRLYITHINKKHDGDVYFPQIDFSKYKLTSKIDDGDLSFCIYERI